MGYKSIETFRGDTLQRIALRELGDASRWVEIARLNGLKPPYIVDDPADVIVGVLVSGGALLLPVEIGSAVADTNDEFLTDLSLPKGALLVDRGDWSLLSGKDNLIQALRHRVTVRKRSLWFHPEYGCWVHDLIGAINGSTAGRLAAFYVKSSVLEDERVSSVESVTAEVSGDTIRVLCVVLPRYGESIAYEQVI